MGGRRYRRLAADERGRTDIRAFEDSQRILERFVGEGVRQVRNHEFFCLVELNFLFLDFTAATKV